MKKLAPARSNRCGKAPNEFPNIFSTTMDVGGSPTGIVATPDGVSVLVTNKDPNTLTQLQFDADSELGWPVTETFGTGDSPVAVAISSSPMLGGPGPESPMGGGGSSSDSCALASPGAAPSIPLYLLIPAFILISRFWRRRTN